MASYKSDVIDFVEQQGGRANVSASEVADHCGCSEDTVYRHWTDVPQLMEGDADDPVDRTTDRETDDAGPYSDGDEPETEPGDLDQGDLEDDADADAEEIEEEDTEQTEDLEPADDDAKTYECGNCGSELDYLQSHCDECGEQPLWSAIDG